MFIGESSCQCQSHFECLTWETSTSYFIFLYVFQLGSLYLSLRPSRAWNCQSVWIIAFRLHICIILIMGSEVSEMVLSSSIMITIIHFGHINPFGICPFNSTLYLSSRLACTTAMTFKQVSLLQFYLTIIKISKNCQNYFSIIHLIIHSTFTLIKLLYG